MLFADAAAAAAAAAAAEPAAAVSDVLKVLAAAPGSGARDLSMRSILTSFMGTDT